MKKSLLAIVFVVTLHSLYAQVNPQEKEAALKLFKSNASAIGLDADESEQYIVSSTYLTGDGIRMVYMNQSYMNVPVYNKMLVLAFKNNQLLSNTGEGVKWISQKASPADATPVINENDAVIAVLESLKIKSQAQIKPIKKDQEGFHYGTLGVSNVDVRVQLVWLPISQKEVKLTWQVEIAPLKTDDHLLIRVDAFSGKILDQNNYTVYENNQELNTTTAHQHLLGIDQTSSLTAEVDAGPTVVNSASYRVIAYPAESPMHSGGTATLVTDPWNLASGNATSLKWHYDGTTYYDSTRGNNVWAQEDRDNNNTTYGRAGVSTTAQPSLTFDITPDYTVAPTTTNFQRFATINLFYWNNIMHDLIYQYGFDEVSGNFQNSNQSRGGLGADFVIADAQDGGGTNNANFSTPVDGSKPRMQMYLGTNVTPNRDGDLDNGVIAHEYAHGISNRLTGGPANSSCLSNAEQAGEGWSDFYALMATTNWATATINDGGLSRPIGNYLFGQAVTGPGIRTYPYSTNMTVNQNTYAMVATAGTSVHRIGEIWCSALWDMTWEIIAMDGINTNLFNAAGTGGNSVALKLVTEGLRLQPCSPGFIDSRNAILKADSILYNGKYKCAIWKAFARRGMGKYASQGSSASTTDQVVDFSDNGGYTYNITQSVSQQQEGLNVTYNHILNAGNCGNLLNHVIRDTLPSNVTYVSGGTYDATNRVVSFSVNVNAGITQTYSYTVQINSGAYYPTANLLVDSVPTSTISSIWTPSSTTTTVWTTSSVQKNSAPYSIFTADIASVSDQKLETTNNILVPANQPILSFQGYINAESGYDGGVIEISNNNGSTWTDLGAYIITGGYNGSLSGLYSNPVGGRSAFTGNSGAFVNTKVNLAAFGGQNVKFRFRFGSDNGVAGTGWYVDDINLTDQARVNIRSSLFNANNTRISTSDTFTIILPGTTCTNGSIISQPTNVAICANQNSATFTISATGTALTYQWQYSINGGFTYTSISGETTNTISLTNVTSSMNGYLYRCIINGTCTSNLTSDAATLNVNPLPVAPAATNASRCGSGAVTISAQPAAGEVIDWYSVASGGTSLLQNSNNYTTPIITSTTSYYAASRNTTSGCVSSSRSTVLAIINSSSTSTTNASVCSNQLPYVWNGTNYNASGSYNKTLVNAVGCDSVATLNLTVKATSTSTTNASVCSNQLPYVWNGTNYNVSGSYNKTLVNAVGCDSVATLNLTVKATSTSTNAVAICSDQLPYIWNANSYTQGGVYAVTLSNAQGCDSIATLYLDVTASPSMFTVTGGGSYSSGGIGLPVGLSSSQNNYQYQLLLNGNAVTGAVVTGNGSAISFGNQMSAGIYTILAMPTTLCAKMMEGSVTISINSNPPAVYTVTGGGYYCSGTAGVEIGLSSSEMGVNYQLLRNNGTIAVGVPVAGTGAAISFGNQVNVDTYTVRATNAINSLTSMMQNSVSVRVVSSSTASGMPGIISGPSNVCIYIGQGTAQYKFNSTLNSTSYLWTVPAGATIIGSATDTSVLVQFASSFISGSISAVSKNACLNSTSTARTLSLTKTVPAAPTAINGPTDVCAYIGNSTNSSPVTYKVSKVANATSYLWTVPAGASISSYGDTSINVIFTSSFVSGNISVTSVSPCGNSTTAKTLTVYKRVAASPSAIQKSFTPSVAAITNVCGSDTQTYRIMKVTYATSYNWTMKNGSKASIIHLNPAGINDTAVIVSFASGYTIDTLQVQAVTACSMSAAKTLVLTRLLLPPAVSTIVSSTGNFAPCTGSVVTYTATAAAPSSTQASIANFTWTKPANTTILSASSDSAVISLSYNVGYNGGSISAKGVTLCGKTGTAKTMTLQYSTPTPTSITSSTGSYNACIGNSVTYTVVVPAPSSTQVVASLFRWTKPNNTTITSANSDSSSITLQFNAGYMGGALAVKGQTSCGVQGSAKSQSLTHTGCAAGLKTGLPISMSTEIKIPEIKVFPNPTHDAFQLFVNNPGNIQVEISIMDLQGRKMEVFKSSDPMYFGSSLKPGIYLLRYTIGDVVKTIRLVKQ